MRQASVCSHGTQRKYYSVCSFQLRIAKAGGLKPLVAMMSVHAEPRHYAGLALLKLADNFENHIAIAEEGGIQALLRLARARSTDEELQYKAALTVGHLASNAVRLLPQAGAAAAGASKSEGRPGGVSRSKAGDRTRAYLEKALKKTRGGN